MSSSRSVRWTKYGGIETTEGIAETPSTVEVAVDDVTIVESESDVAAPSKWDQRGTSAHIPAPDPKPVVEPRTEWVVTRTIDGRTYRRSDALTVIEESAG